MARVKDFFEQGLSPALSGTVSYEQWLPILMDGISDYIFFMEVAGRRRFKYVYMNHPAQTHFPIDVGDFGRRRLQMYQ